jgi:hypothetical protein
VLVLLLLWVILLLVLLQLGTRGGAQWYAAGV